MSAYANNILDRWYDVTRQTGLNGIFGIPGASRMVGAGSGWISEPPDPDPLWRRQP